MPTATYTALATLTLTGGDSSITFASIPATYRDLVVVCQFQMSGTSSASRLRLNGDTGTRYYGVWLAGYSSVGSGREANSDGARIVGAAFGPTATFANSLILQVMDYSATDKQKTVLSRYGAADGEVQATGSRWESTAAINSLTIYDVLGQTYQTGSTFSLYGIAS